MEETADLVRIMTEDWERIPDKVKADMYRQDPQVFKRRTQALKRHSQAQIEQMRQIALAREEIERKERNVATLKTLLRQSEEYQKISAMLSATVPRETVEAIERDAESAIDEEAIARDAENLLNKGPEAIPPARRRIRRNPLASEAR